MWGLDPDSLAFVPRPTAAVMLLYPISKIVLVIIQNEEFRAARNAKIDQHLSSNLVFYKQTVGNACGTIGLLHALANNTDRIQVGSGAFANIYANTKNLNPSQRADYLAHSNELSEIHKLSASQGQTQAPSADEDVDLHFICFVCIDGHMYEMDGLFQLMQVGINSQ